jgi:hypothetical protein
LRIPVCEVPEWECFKLSLQQMVGTGSMEAHRGATEGIVNILRPGPASSVLASLASLLSIKAPVLG